MKQIATIYSSVHWASVLAFVVCLSLIHSQVHGQSRADERVVIRSIVHGDSSIAAKVDRKSGAPVWILDVDAMPFNSGKARVLNSKSDVEQASVAFLEAYNDVFKADPKNLKNRSITTNGQLWFVNFVQIHEGMRVLNSDVGITVTRSGKLIAAGSRAYPVINVETTPGVSLESAVTAARQEAGLDDASVVKSGELVIVPEELEDSYSFNLAWQLRLVDESSGKLKDRTVFIDAHDQSVLAEYDNVITTSDRSKNRPFFAASPVTDQDLKRKNVPTETAVEVSPTPSQAASGTANSVFGYVKLNYYETPDDYTQPNDRFTSRPFVNAKVTVTDDQTLSSQTTYADGNGYYSVSGLNSGSHTVTFEIANERAHIESGVSTGKTQKDVQVNVSGATQKDYNWGWGDDGDGGLTSYALNGVYHVWETYDYFKDTYGYDFDGSNDIDRDLRIMSSGTGSTNGVDITIGGAEAMSSEVTLHEYSHGIIYRLYNNAFMHTGQPSGSQEYDESYAMDEGFADYFTTDHTNHQMYGGPQADADPYAPAGDGVAIRYMYNTCTMNDFNGGWPCGSDPHNRGRIIGGAIWRIRIALGTEASDLLFSALQITPLAHTFEDLRDRYFAVDDAANSGANKYTIEEKFTDRYIGGPLEPSNPSINTDADGHPVLTWADNSSVEDGYRVERKSGSTGTWQTVASLAAGSTSYTDSYTCVPNKSSGRLYYRIQAYYVNSGNPDEVSYSPASWYDLENCISPYKRSPDREADAALPGSTRLEAAYPNPFNPQTTITYDLADDGPVRLVVLDALGREVITLVDRVQTAGSHEVTLDASNLPSGLYIYRLKSADGTFSGTVLLTK